MAEDIVPELYAKIENTFNNKVKLDPMAKSLAKKTEEGRASLKDTYTYAKLLSGHAISTLILHLREDNLPDGKLYWNIAERTIMPLYRHIHDMIIDMAVAVTRAEDKKQGIGLKPIRPEFNEERIRVIINEIVRESLREDKADE